ncbi:hypothetical protein GCM10010954_23870 [Halobacillus andaensis]|uniref:Uncharacterized protein n=1 Tax=Halobacillus andaensis TaxID=1176239 RepID=A0A917EW92_HALAA|nr:hypothetical protein [Halobacillus andaensis]MBP2006023.1 hypothetical protein [Halobacillus andaensis]GGF24210.1 hypothetical protein GCM10010954_23870 [Halobacillus andaensis]
MSYVIAPNEYLKYYGYNIIERKIGFNLLQLHYLNTGSYERGIRSQYIDDEGIQYNGMRTDQLAIWIIEGKEACIENVSFYHGVLGVQRVNTREDLERYIDTSKLSDREVQTLLLQVNDTNNRGMKHK